VDQDYRIAKRYRPQDNIEWGHYQALERLGRHLEMFEQIFRDCSAPINPLVAITPIVDHLPKIMAVTGLGALDLDELQNTPLAQPGVMVDYLKTYVVDGNLDVPRLFNDDYFEAIKLLYNARHWVSAAKLLMSFLIPLRLLTWATWQATSRYGWTNTLISMPSASLRKNCGNTATAYYT
jgi:hypothetical protein